MRSSDNIDAFFEEKRFSHIQDWPLVSETIRIAKTYGYDGLPYRQHHRPGQLRQEFAIIEIYNAVIAAERIHDKDLVFWLVQNIVRNSEVSNERN